MSNYHCSCCSEYHPTSHHVVGCQCSGCMTADDKIAALEAEVERLTKESDEDKVAVAAEMVADIETDATKRNLDLERENMALKVRLDCQGISNDNDGSCGLEPTQQCYACYKKSMAKYQHTVRALAFDEAARICDRSGGGVREAADKIRELRDAARAAQERK